MQITSMEMSPMHTSLISVVCYGKLKKRNFREKISKSQRQENKTFLCFGLDSGEASERMRLTAEPSLSVSEGRKAPRAAVLPCHEARPSLQSAQAEAL